MKKTILIFLSLAFLSSCGTPAVEKQLIKIENGTVKTKYFTITLPSQWRVASSLTNEVRDSYYPERFTPLQRFAAYDPVVFDKILEIGIYTKFVPTFKDFAKGVDEITPGDRITKSEQEISGLKFTKYTCLIGTTEKNPTTYIAENKDYYIHIVTQNTWKDMEDIIKSLVFTDGALWKENFISEAESSDTSYATYAVIGRQFNSRVINCTLPEGWKIKKENDLGVILINTDSQGQEDVINCFVSENRTIKELTESIKRTMSNPKVEELTYGNNNYIKISDPTDGTTKSIYFIQKGKKLVSFFCSSPTTEPTKDRISILSSIVLN